MDICSSVFSPEASSALAGTMGGILQICYTEKDLISNEK
jgi:hypothetical protein